MRWSVLRHKTDGHPGNSGLQGKQTEREHGRKTHPGTSRERGHRSWHPLGPRQRQKFLWGEGSPREPRFPNRAFEIVALVDANPYRTVAGSLGRKRHLGRSLQHTIHIIVESLAIVSHGNMMPGAERMKLCAVHQRL